MVVLGEDRAEGEEFEGRDAVLESVLLFFEPPLREVNGFLVRKSCRVLHESVGLCYVRLRRLRYVWLSMFYARRPRSTRLSF